MEDKDSETFDLFFYNLSVKISETFFSKKFITTKESADRFKHVSNANSEDIIKILVRNIPQVAKIISANLEIIDVKSIETVLRNHFLSLHFKEKMNDITKPFYTNGELTKERYLVEYGQFIKFALTSDSLKDKIFNLKTHDNFKDWLISKKETVLCGFSLVVFLLSFTFYVFVD
tara:strand:- start:26760 stop:27281 length:522 start_codon:yes stop_codon:yes gene_type:complete